MLHGIRTAPFTPAGRHIRSRHPSPQVIANSSKSVTPCGKLGDYPCATCMGANLEHMGYRGDDGARERAAWGAQSPRQSSGEHAEYDRPGYDGPGYDRAGYDDSAYTSTSYDAYGQGDGYGQRDGYGP